MHITKIRVNGFKSLVDFEMDLSKFNCLIGLNGSGKSTVLQFLDFLSQLIRGDMEGWLKERQWEKSDIRGGIRSKPTVYFRVDLLRDDRQPIWWEGIYRVSTAACVAERLETPETTLQTAGGKLIRRESGAKEVSRQKIIFKYHGSLLSQLTEKEVPTSVLEIKRYFLNSHSSDLLSPESLRRRTRKAAGSIGLGGQNLAAFLSELEPQGRKLVTDNLEKPYPNLQELIIKTLRSGWKELSIKESYSKESLITKARHVSDGMLRLVALLAETESDHDFLLFDEIENGINPELVAFLIQILTNARQQIMVTTHSPLILNYLDDETAQESVVYLYKTEEGATKAIKFFDIPYIKKKLEVMGPGEAFADTDLIKLAKEIKNLPPKEAE